MQQHVINAGFHLTGVQTQTSRSVALGIEVDDKDSISLFGQTRAHIDSGCGFAYATLLIRHRNDPWYRVRQGGFRFYRIHMTYILPKAD